MTNRKPESSIEYHQLRGAGWNIVDEAILTYDEWMLDDDYEFDVILKKIINRMKERRALYHGDGLAECAGGKKEG